MDGSKVISGEFVEALRQAPHVFETTEEPFDQIAFTIKPFVVRLWASGIRPVGNDRHRAVIPDRLPDMLAIIGLVGTDRERRGRVGQQPRQHGGVVRFASGQDEVERSSQSIDHGMEFRRAATA